MSQDNGLKRIYATVQAGAILGEGDRVVQELVLLNSDGTAASTIKKQAAQANSTATTVADLVTDFNALLTKLRAAGVITSS